MEARVSSVISFGLGLAYSPGLRALGGIQA